MTNTDKLLLFNDRARIVIRIKYLNSRFEKTLC
jgi:hypothetical protein